jgi:hypothetical protein
MLPTKATPLPLLELLLEELDDELLDELEELEELELDAGEPLIVPVETVRVTRSSLAPSSRRTILKV